MEDFVCDFQELSLCFPQSCRNPIIKSCCLQSQILWGFPVPLPDLLAGKPDVRLRIITTVKKENFFGIIVLQIVGGLAGRYRILFYHVCPSPSASLWLLLCVCVCGFLSLDMGYLFFGHGVPASSCQWLFNTSLRFRCSCRKRWVHVLLLHDLELENLHCFYCTIDSLNLALNSLGCNY